VRHKHRYWFVSRYFSSFVMQRMHVCNAQWENTAGTQVTEIFILWIISNSYLIPQTQFWFRYLISFSFSIDIQQSIVNATNYTVPKSFMIILEHKKNTWHTPKLLVDCVSINQLHDRTLLIDKTRRRKIVGSLRHMSQQHGLLWH
jgi:hypothetical protein